MTQTGYANAIINTMLGWLKALANWVLKLFNLAGGGSPLAWLSRNWLKLLILLMIIGIVTDFVVWMLRWRPYWAWLRRKRIIVNDERMLAGEQFADVDSKRSDGLCPQSYVVKNQNPKPAAKPRTAGSGKRTATPGGTARTPGASGSKVGRPVYRKGKPAPRKKGFSLLHARPVRTKQIDDEMFETGRTNSDYTEYDQDQVFDVSNLPDKQRREKKEFRRGN